MRPFQKVQESWNGDGSPKGGESNAALLALSVHERYARLKAAVWDSLPDKQRSYGYHLLMLGLYGLILGLAYGASPFIESFCQSIRYTPRSLSPELWQATHHVWANLVSVAVALVLVGCALMMFFHLCAIFSLKMDRPDWHYSSQKPPSAALQLAFQQLYPEFDLNHPLVLKSNLTPQMLLEYAQDLKRG